MAHLLHLHVPPYTLPRILCLGQQPVTFQHWARRGEDDIITVEIDSLNHLTKQVSLTEIGIAL